MSVEDALTAWQQGKLVALPTETVYGLAAPVNDHKAIENIFYLKKRPSFDPLIIHLSDEEMAKRYSLNWCDSAQKLAQAFWPGPLTIVVRKSDKVSDLITSGLPTVGLRVPNKMLARELIKALGHGVAAPSANLFTQTSPTCIEHVKKYFKEDDVYFLDDGPCEVGIESTIVEVNEGSVTLLRSGMITSRAIENLTGIRVIERQVNQQSPGNFKVHYKPDYPLIVIAREENCSQMKEFRLYDKDFEGTAEFIDIIDDAEIFARELYAYLHKPLSSDHRYKIINLKSYALTRDHENWQGILDRLKKASEYFLVT